MLTLACVAPLDELAGANPFRPELPKALLYALGVALLGLVDDLVGSRPPVSEPLSEPPRASLSGMANPPRGWRGHARAVAEGRLSTGVLKAVGALGLALYVLAGEGRSPGSYLVAVALLVLTTNLLNLLDLRPGRAAKSFLAVGAVLTLASWDTAPLRTLGLLAGPVLVLLPYDLRERAMLGDVGSNLLGAVAGLWLVLALSPTGEAIALAAVIAITLVGEFRSISAIVEKNPLLRRLDSLGRR
jgi:UDP-GlcNAc:undecaprenyl-phosphate GlcNAc-1-phosphate transferase